MTTLCTAIMPLATIALLFGVVFALVSFLVSRLAAPIVRSLVNWNFRLNRGG